MIIVIIYLVGWKKDNLLDIWAIANKLDQGASS